MRFFPALLLAFIFLSAPPPTSDRTNAMEIYVIDVEGGKATLLVSPFRESLLVDTGNIGDGAARDAARIIAAIEDAGLQRIDHLVTTHWHRDHFGAMALVAQRVPIRDFIDHGANVQPDAPVDRFLQQTYPLLYGKAQHTVAKAGDPIPLAGLEVRVVSSGGEVISRELPGAGEPSRSCAGLSQPAPDTTENARAIGIHVTFGQFRLVDLSDLTADKEFELMCPNNLLGTVDLFMVSHHGQPSSNSRWLVHGLQSRAAIMNNGIRKGGQPAVMEALYSAPGLEDLWQLHFSELSGQEYSAPGLFIANAPDKPAAAVSVAPMPPPLVKGVDPRAPVHDGKAHWIKVTAQRDGSFDVTNGRNGFSKNYRGAPEARGKD